MRGRSSQGHRQTINQHCCLSFVRCIKIYLDETNINNTGIGIISKANWNFLTHIALRIYSNISKVLIKLEIKAAYLFHK